MDLQKTIGVIGLACAVWVIYDVFANNQKKGMGWKIAWTVCAILFSIVTAIIYYLVNKR